MLINENSKMQNIVSMISFLYAKQLYVLLTDTNLHNESINHAIQNSGYLTEEGTVSGREVQVFSMTRCGLFPQKVKPKANTAKCLCSWGSVWGPLSPIYTYFLDDFTLTHVFKAFQ